MIPNQLISFYIDRLTIDDAIKLAKKHGVSFTTLEAQTILNFIKENKNLFNIENKEYLENKIKKVVDSTTYSKIQILIKKFLG